MLTQNEINAQLIDCDEKLMRNEEQFLKGLINADFYQHTKEIYSSKKEELLEMLKN